MHDISELKPNGKETAIAILVVFILLLVAGSIGYMLGLRNAGAGVPDNGNAAKHVRNEIESVGSGVSTAKSRIDNAAAAAGRVEERLSDAQERARYVQGTADEGRRIIEECQSVLREVRAGGKKDPTPH